MGLTIRLEDEEGEPFGQVLDPMNHLHRLLPSHTDPASSMLRFIDWYGDTVFNQLQIPRFLFEWAALKPQGEQESILVDQVATLARRVLEEDGLYLKFYGD